MYILTALMGFILGLLAGAGMFWRPKDGRKTDGPPVQENPAVVRARKEYENFLRYDGSDQEEIF
ncbi:MAG: YtxH domain-containing protein [Clostridiales bacterium]|nr:YtxH domain-containing protein [Clostridiales bacterium]